MIAIGVLTINNITTATGIVTALDGSVEKNVLGWVCDDVFAATARALVDAAFIRARGVKLYTNDDRLLKFLTPPISIKPTSITIVKGWGAVGIGGDPNQWTILYKLFACGAWSIQKAQELPGTGAIYEEYCKTARDGLQGCCRRLYEGVWASA